MKHRLSLFAAAIVMLLVVAPGMLGAQAAAASTLPEMVFVDGGTFQMGDTFGDGNPDAKPIHYVTVPGFWIAKTEVTFDQYDRFCEATGRSKPSDMNALGTTVGRGSHPVFGLSWFEAVQYCNWLSQTEGLTPFYTLSGANVSMNWYPR